MTPDSCPNDRRLLTRSHGIAAGAPPIMRHLVSSSILAAALALLPRPALAAPDAHLVYSRSADASSCPDEDALRRAVIARVGYDPFSPSAARTVVATIRTSHRAFVATVALTDGAGTHAAHELRTEGPCGDVLEAIALAIAIVVDPSRALAENAGPEDEPDDEEAPPPVTPPGAPEAEPETAPGVDPPSAAPKLRSVEAVPGTPLRLEGAVGVVASAGVAPAIAFGLSVGGAVRWRAFSLGLEARVDAPAGERSASGGSVSSWLTLAAVTPCAHVWALFACGVFQAGSMNTFSSGVSTTRSTSLAWWAAGGRIGALVPVTRGLSLRVRFDVVADLSPASLVLDGAAVWNAPTLAGSVGTDVVLPFR